MKILNKNFALIKIFIIYDSFIFDLIYRKYSIYKRELYIIKKIIKKYNYLYKHFYHIIIIYINYKSFIYFLDFDIYERIYKY